MFGKTQIRSFFLVALLAVFIGLAGCSADTSTTSSGGTGGTGGTGGGGGGGGGASDTLTINGTTYTESGTDPILTYVNTTGVTLGVTTGGVAIVALSTTGTGAGTYTQAGGSVGVFVSGGTTYTGMSVLTGSSFSITLDNAPATGSVGTGSFTGTFCLVTGCGTSIPVSGNFSMVNFIAFSTSSPMTCSPKAEMKCLILPVTSTL